MVFEGIVAQLVNQFLGDFIENLDASQLNLGIFGGDVELKNLMVKDTALDQFDLPVKLKFGYLNHLVLKIPWKNLYTEPVIANIEGLHIIVVPNLGIQYDDKKETKQQHEKKQSELENLEEARANRRKKREKNEAVPDTFVEKMVTQVIKNLQVSVKSIHVRYEDEFTDRSRPFAAGLTLNELQFQTTDGDWKPCIIKETVKLIYKLVELEHLCVYWNSGTELFSALPSRQEITEKMVSCVASKDGRPKEFRYIVEPISLSAKLRLNQKPESDGTNFQTPKILLNAIIDQVALHVGKYQFQDVLKFLEAQERFVLNGTYRKYRPPKLFVYRGHYKEWWHFAFNCILEEQVRRRRRNWSWDHMKSHCELRRKYREAWVEKLTNKSPSKNTVAVIEKAEKEMGVFNLNLARQQADLDVEKRGLTRVEDQQGWVGWASSWFTGGGGKKEEKKDIATQFEEAMTPEEKQRLYDAIDYDVDAPPTNYPIEFVENEVHTVLNTLAVVVEDDIEDGMRQEVIRFALTNVRADVEQRPSDRALKVDASIETAGMSGMAAEPKGDKVAAAPIIIQMAQKGQTDVPLVAAAFEMRPLDRACDQFVGLRAQPIHVIFHAPTINRLTVIFRPPESVRLKQLTTAAMAQYETVKAHSVTGLAHAVEQRSRLKLDIVFHPATIIVPERGVFAKTSHLLIADLGTLKIHTVDSLDSVDGVPYPKEDDGKDEKLKRLMEEAYDKICIELATLQLLFASPTDDWNNARKKSNTPLHLLEPTGFKFLVHKSTIDDLQLPKIRFFGALPDIVVNITDDRLLEIMKLALSIPTPEAPPPPPDVGQQILVPEMSTKDRAKVKQLMDIKEISEEDEGIGSDEEEEKETQDEQKSPEAAAQQVQFEATVVLNTVVESGEPTPFLVARIKELGAEVKMRQFDLVASAYLGNIEVEHLEFKGMGSKSDASLFLVENPFKGVSTKRLFQLSFVQANRLGPTFATDYELTEQKATVRFEALDVALHQEAFVTLQQFGMELARRLAEVQNEAAARRPATFQPTLPPAGRLSRTQSVVSRISEGVQLLGGPAPPTKLSVKRRVSATDKELVARIVKFAVEASMGQVRVTIGTKTSVASVISVADLKACVKMREKEMQVKALLSTASIFDDTPPAVHPNILSVQGEKMFVVEFTQYNRTKEEKEAMTADDVDMAVKMTLNEMRFVFLNAWLNRLLCWVAPFQEEAALAAEKAGSKLADTATEAAKNIKEAPPRIRLDINLAAPWIFVPVKSDSNEALVIDLGYLSVQNVFTERRVGGAKAIVDELQLSLTDLVVSRALVDDKYSFLSHCQLLERVSLRVNVERNHSFDACSSIPELKVAGDLPLISASLSQEDYVTIMRTLSGNLAEGTPPRQRKTATSVAEQTQPPAQAAEQTTVVAVETHDREGDAGVGGVRPQSSTIEPTARRVALDVKLSGLSANLYSGSSKLIAGSGLVARDSDNHFAGILVEQVALSVSMLQNEAMAVSAMLANVIMNDERPNLPTRITRLMDKRVDAQQRNLVDVKLVREPNLNQTIDLHSCAFFLLLCPEFLGSLAKFFIVPAEHTDVPSSVSPKTSSAPLKKKNLAAKSAESKPSGRTEISLQIEEPEVVLVEDASRPEETQAVILSFRVGGTVVQELDGTTTVQAGVDSLTIFSDYFAKEKRSKNPLKVLKRCSVNALVKQDADGSQRIDVDLGDICFRLSPPVIRLLSSVAANIGAKEPTTEEEQRLNFEKRRMQASRTNVWEDKTLVESDHWFLTSVLPADEATEEVDFGFEEQVSVAPSSQQLIAKLNSFELMLEAGVGQRTVPIIQVESSLSAEARNWSSQLFATATISLLVNYYNESCSVWEPLVEPVEAKPGAYLPWEATLQVQQHSELDAADADVTSQPPVMSISVFSTDMMQATVTKSCLESLQKLGEAFQMAAKRSEPPRTSSLPAGDSPFFIKNETGIPIEIRESDALIIGKGDEPMIRLNHGEISPLEFRESGERRGSNASSRAISDPMRRAAEKANIFIQFPDQKDTSAPRELSISRAERRTFVLPYKAAADGDNWRLVADVTAEYGGKLVTLRSALQIINHLEVAVDVMSDVDTNLETCGVAEPNGGCFNVPIPAVYSVKGEFYIKPLGDDYKESAEGIKWRTVKASDKATDILRCVDDDNQRHAFYVEYASEVEHCLFENTTKQTLDSRSYRIHLRPPVVFHNALPIELTVEPPNAESSQLKGGEAAVLHTVYPGLNAAPLKMTIVVNNAKYSAELPIVANPDELIPVDFRRKSADAEQTLTLGVRADTVLGRGNYWLYCPFWMINETGRLLTYKESGSGRTTGTCCTRKSSAENGPTVVEHPVALRGPLLFSFGSSQFLAKKKAQLKIGDSDFSDEFPIDIVGSSGRIVCKSADGQIFEVSVRIQLSNSGLTKICTFTPFYLLNNQSNMALEVRQGPATTAYSDAWQFVDAASCVGFWPAVSENSKKEKKVLHARYGDSNDVMTQDIPFTENFESLAKLNSNDVGLYVTCAVGESQVVVNFEDYENGMAPALLINHTDLPVGYAQKLAEGKGQSAVLAPRTTRLFAWKDMSKNRTVIWSSGKLKDVEEGLYKDGSGRYEDEQGHVYYWVSFLSGRQRNLLFTTDLAIATVSQQAYELERAEQQVTVSLHGFGLSLVNNLIGKEIAYICIKSSGILWERKQKKRFRPMNIKECQHFEAAYNQWLAAKESKRNPKVMVDKHHVDFENMSLLSAGGQPTLDIRRSFQVGLWLQYKSGQHLLQLHVKLNHLQVDNQLPASVFDVVLAPVPPSKSVAADSAPKPFAEASFVMRKTEHSNIPQIKYFKVLVQEMALQADQGFINAMLTLVRQEDDDPTKRYGPDLFAKDMEMTRVELSAVAAVASSSEAKAFYDSLHFSPLKIHLSFSQGGSTGDDSNRPLAIQSEFLGLMLKSVGVTLTELQDVVFKLAYFEREHVFLSQTQLIQEASGHYTKQAIKQIYVLVLGLDIIGNPFGLLRDLSSGVQDFFYEPISGAVQGPEEFAEGLATGVRSLFGHAVGGAAGAVSRITGTLGKGIAALTLDDEYQRKRQEAINRRPATFHEGVAQGGKNLAQGVFDGVTGVFLKPVEGLQKEGAVGLAKGVGKGLIGLVARPASGVVDFASGSLSGIKKFVLSQVRVVDTTETVKRIRPARLIYPDHILRSYSIEDAEGYRLLRDLDKGKYTATDHYLAHSILHSPKFVAFVTDNRIILAERSSVFGSLDCTWQHSWEELKGAPSKAPSFGVKVEFKHVKAKFMGVFGGGEKGRVLKFPNQEMTDFMLGKAVDAYNQFYS